MWKKKKYGEKKKKSALAERLALTTIRSLKYLSGSPLPPSLFLTFFVSPPVPFWWSTSYRIRKEAFITPSWFRSIMSWTSSRSLMCLCFEGGIWVGYMTQWRSGVWSYYAVMCVVVIEVLSWYHAGVIEDLSLFLESSGLTVVLLLLSC